MSHPSAPEKTDGFTAFRTTFPVRLWVLTLFAVCVLTWYFAIPAEPETESAGVPAAVPAAQAPSGNAG